jgi:hypothetical protein
VFQDYYADSKFAVVWDRRCTERRTRTRRSPIVKERRRRQRRGPPPSSWQSPGYVLIHGILEE